MKLIMGNKKIKILHIQETINSGGVERIRFILAKYLDKTKYEQKIICTFAGGSIVDDIEREGVEIIPIGRFKGIFDFKQYRKVLKIINNYKPDIIHGAVFEGVTMACVCGFIKKVPVIIAEETSDPQNRSKKANFLLRLLCLSADKVVAISVGTEEYLKKTAKIPLKKIHLINNGVEYPRYVTEEEIEFNNRKWGIKPGDIVIGSIGRLYDDHKKFTDIIKAISLLKNHSNIKLLIVGDGPDREMITQTAKDNGILDRIILAGYQDDVSLYYQLMDIYCIASQREGFGLVAAEAMLNKLPVIATCVGGLKFMVEDSVTGFLVPPSNPDIIAEKINVLITNPEIRMNFGERGRVKASREYTANVYISNVEKMYCNLFSQNNV